MIYRKSYYFSNLLFTHEEYIKEITMKIHIKLIYHIFMNIAGFKLFQGVTQKKNIVVLENSKLSNELIKISF